VELTKTDARGHARGLAPDAAREPQLTVLRAADEILARELADIDRAAQMIVLDQRPVARAIGQRLLLAKRRRPNLTIVVVADDLDEASGGTPREYLQALEQAGVIVARARLDRLRDSDSALFCVMASWHRLVERSVRRDARRLKGRAAPPELQTR